MRSRPLWKFRARTSRSCRLPIRPALIADGNHARIDRLVSLAVVANAAVVAVEFELGDPLIGLVITMVIPRISWQSVQTLKAEPNLG